MMKRILCNLGMTTLTDESRMAVGSLAMMLVVLTVAGCSDSNPINPSPEAVGDTIPPGRIADIEAGEITSSRVKLRWTAPGDDGSEGQAWKYELFVANFEITDENIGEARNMNSSIYSNDMAMSEWSSYNSAYSIPSRSGARDSVGVWYLKSGLTYWFAVRTLDAARNTSSVSVNCRVEMPIHPHLQRAVFRLEGWSEPREIAPGNILKHHRTPLGYGATASAGALWSIVPSGDPFNDSIRREDWGNGTFRWDGERLYQVHVFYEARPVLRVLDSPHDRQVLGSCPLPGYSNNYKSLVRFGQKLFFAGEDSLCVVDMTEPTSPQSHGFRHGLPGAWGYQICALGEYLLAWSVGQDSPLLVFDVSNPLEPALAGQYDPSTNYMKVCVRDGYIYVIAGNGDIQVVNATDPAIPALEGVIQLGGPINDADIASDWLYTVNRESGLRYYSLASPGSFELAGTCDVALNPNKVAAFDDMIFVYDDVGYENFQDYLVILRRFSQ